MREPQSLLWYKGGGNLAPSSEQNCEVLSVRVLVHAEMKIQILHQGGRVFRKISGIYLTFYFWDREFQENEYWL